MLVGILELLIVNYLFKIFSLFTPYSLTYRKRNNLLSLQMSKNKVIPKDKSFRSWERNAGFLLYSAYISLLYCLWLGVKTVSKSNVSSTAPLESLCVLDIFCNTSASS